MSAVQSPTSRFLAPKLSPEKIIVTDDARNDILTKRVLERLPNIPVELVESANDPLRSAEDRSSDENISNSAQFSRRFSQGKRQLMLTRFNGTWLSSCPGTSQHVCCNLWTVNPGEGCPMDCTYCYLQSYLKRNPTLKLFTNTSEMCLAIERRLSMDPFRLIRVGTGEVIDSLVWDTLTDLSHELVPLFGRHKNGILELKTKSDNIANLLELKNEHNNKVVVSWSLNARSVSEHDEALTAPRAARLAAAGKLAEIGYRIGIHFDPLIHFTGWEEEYFDLIDETLAAIPHERIAWISVSSLRFKPEMQETMKQRFPESKIPYGEQFLAADRKLRYFQPLRFRMLQFAWREIKARAPDVPLYMCMESSAAWRSIAGGAPVAGSELVEIFSRKGRIEKQRAELLG